MKNDLFCVALIIEDDGKSDAISKKECTKEDLKILKEKDENEEILLIGWLPIEFYNGVDVNQQNENFRFW